MLKVATITHLFPNPIQPVLGVFVLHRVKAMARYLSVEVIAPVGWLPKGISKRPKVVPKLRIEDGLQIYHPRYISPPVLKPLESLFFFAGTLSLFFLRHQKVGFNVLDTHFGYPDAPAVWILSRLFRLPYVVTVRGEDVYGHPRFPLRRVQIERALKDASRVVCLSDVTQNACIDLGVSAHKIVQIPNGVDGDVFKIIDRVFARQTLGLPLKAPILLSAGWIIPRKGYHYVIQALPQLCKKFPNIRYIIVGSDTATGEYKRYLTALVRKLGVEQFVVFVDAQPQERLALWMSAADVFCLSSEKEGWGNVVAEALCCGTPVIAHDVGGVYQMIADGVNGVILPQKSPDLWVDAIIKVLSKEWDRSGIRASVAHLRWENVGKQVADLMETIWREFTQRKPSSQWS